MTGQSSEPFPAGDAADLVVADDVPGADSAALDLAVLDARVAAALRGALAPNTWRAYTSDWRHWSSWARRQQLPVLPADPLDLARYLVAHARPAPSTDAAAAEGGDSADTDTRAGEPGAAAAAGPAGGLSIGTLTRRLSAVGKAHQLAGHADPTDDPAVREVLRGLRRQNGSAKRGAPPLWTSDVERMVAATLTVPSPAGPGLGLAEVRDRALLLLAFSTALRRSELAALNIADLEPDPAGLVVHVRRSKTDQAGDGAYVGVPHGSRPALCPVRATAAWLDALARHLGLTADVLVREVGGPLFRPVDRHGRLGSLGATRHGPHARLSPDAVRTALVRRATAAGLQPAHGDRFFTAHSTRSGFATQAAANGATEASIMAQGRWKSLQVARSYIRRGSVFTDNAAARLGL